MHDVLDFVQQQIIFIILLFIIQLANRGSFFPNACLYREIRTFSVVLFCGVHALVKTQTQNPHNMHIEQL